jgi:uncharacterized repeat protein (TIGR03943 family)
MGLFLYWQVYNGTVLYYINQRFVWLTLLAAIGFIIVGSSYRQRGDRADHIHEHEPHHHEDQTSKVSQTFEVSAHSHAGHAHGNLGWGGLWLVALPIILGLLIPPKPLGAAAMSNRQISLDSLTTNAAPQSSQLLNRPGDKNVLDWLIDFRIAKNPADFTDQEAKVIGFVYRDDRFAADRFMVSRFVISCCAADAAPLGLVVQWPDTAALASDQWVEVAGRFQPGEFDGDPTAILVADSVTPTQVPQQPYLYPY